MWTFYFYVSKPHAVWCSTMNRKGPKAVQTVCVLLTYLFMFHFFSQYNSLVLTCMVWACICLWLNSSKTFRLHTTVCDNLYQESCTWGKTGKSKKLMNIYKESKNKIKISNVSVYSNFPFSHLTNVWKRFLIKYQCWLALVILLVCYHRVYCVKPWQIC